MTEYALYLESGPRRRKTMVHVPDLLGCIAQGPTAEEALEATPEGIRAYLRFLQQHGEPADPDAPFTTTIAAHVMEGSWIGNGDPFPGFTPDFQPLTTKELGLFSQRMRWLEEDLVQLVRRVPLEQMLVQPATGGRPTRQIIEHVAGAHSAYMQTPLSRPPGLNAAYRAIEQGPDLPAALAAFWQLANTGLVALTEAQCTEQVPHGQVTWTARRGLRRMLEHAWEHLLEISRRF